MAADPRVQQLLEEVLESRRSPEEVCRDHPELLAEVRLRWQRLESIQARIGALLPEPESTSGVDAAPSALRIDDPPHIPGYEVEAVLGHGGMGIVYRALDTRLHRIVALKMLSAAPTCARESASDSSGRPRRPPACATPTSCRSTTSATTTGGRYFTMEFVEGGNLAQQLSGAPLPARRAAELLATLARPCRRPTRAGSSTVT